MKSGSLPYAPSLDGLRGVAVTLVVCAHTVPNFAVGRVGVDFFFVLSGYLITTILLSEWQAWSGVDLKAFYARRFLRLFPPLAVLLVAYVAATPIWLSAGVSPGQLLVLLGVSASYTWNLLIVLLSARPSGVWGGLSHLWSLAQEEQFYLFFPLLLLFALRRGARAVVLLWSAILPGSVMLLLYTLTAGSLFAEFSPVTRGFGLLTGCLLAVGRCAGLALRVRASLAWTTVLGLTLVISGSVLGWLPEGIDIPTAVLTSFVVTAHVTESPTGVMGRVLQGRPLVWLGLVSYSLYLWHLPLLVISRDVWGWTPVGSAAWAIPCALVLAQLTRRFVELPMARVKERWVRAQPARRLTAEATPAAREQG